MKYCDYYTVYRKGINRMLGGAQYLQLTICDVSCKLYAQTKVTLMTFNFKTANKSR